jgi:2'-5' RNA ligase
MRAFIALPLPAAVQGALHGLQRELAGTGADVKWVEPSQLHVTLKFLGQITEPQRQAVEAVVKKVAAEVLAYPAALGRVGAFPSMAAPRVVWVGLAEGAAQTAQLAELIEREAAAISLATENLPAPRKEQQDQLQPARQAGRPFSAHVTLGRVRSPRGRGALVRALRETRWSPPPGWTASSVVLYQSVLGSSGPTYSVLAELAFSK